VSSRILCRVVDFFFAKDTVVDVLWIPGVGVEMRARGLEFVLDRRVNDVATSPEVECRGAALAPLSAETGAICSASVKLRHFASVRVLRFQGLVFSN
jgi:hypothetical protein